MRKKEKRWREGWEVGRRIEERREKVHDAEQPSLSGAAAEDQDAIASLHF